MHRRRGSNSNLILKRPPFRNLLCARRIRGKSSSSAPGPSGCRLRSLLPAGLRPRHRSNRKSGTSRFCSRWRLLCYCSRCTALQVKCKVGYLNLVPVQNQTSPLVMSFNVADPVGATGIQADLASFAAMGCHGLSVITAIAIGDTARVEDAQTIDADWVSDQARTVLEDMAVAAFKIGYLGGVENVSVIAEIVSDYPDIPLVLDPFSSRMPDLGSDGEDLLVAMRELLVPQTTVLLLSAVELARLAETWREPSSRDMLASDAMHLIDLGCEFV